MIVRVSATINGACYEKREIEVPNEYPWTSTACNTSEQKALIKRMFPHWKDICIDTIFS